MTKAEQLPIILGITGASGSAYGMRMLQFLLDNEYPVELVLSNNALEVFYHELGLEFRGLELEALKQELLAKLEIRDDSRLTIWDHKNIAAKISSGSYQTAGMIIAPCSMGSLANIAAGTSNNLVARAADVVLKERRKLVLVARETPLSTIHLRNMLTLSEMGAVILPAAPGFYHNPKTIQDQVDFVVGKALSVFGIEHKLFAAWSGSVRETINV